MFPHGVWNSLWGSSSSSSSSAPCLALSPCERGAILLRLASPTTGKPGMSFFIVISQDVALVQAAHSFCGGGELGGCQAYPRDAVPARLSLMVDAVQVSDADGAPVLLHASVGGAARHYE